MSKGIDVDIIERNISVLAEGKAEVKVFVTDGETCICNCNKDIDLYTDGWITESSKGNKVYNYNIIVTIGRDTLGIAKSIDIILKNNNTSVEKLFDIINIDTASYIFN